MTQDCGPYERFSNLASAIQSCAVASAIVIGGGWTLYTFVATDVEKRAAKELFQQAQIDIEIEAAHQAIENGRHCIAAIVSITNNGARNVLLDYSEAPFSVARVEFDEQGNSHFEAELKQSNLMSRSRVLRAGETAEYPFFVVVKSLGLYVVQFRVPLPPGEMPEHTSVGGPPGKISWVGSTYVVVKGESTS